MFREKGGLSATPEEQAVEKAQILAYAESLIKGTKLGLSEESDVWTEDLDKSLMHKQDYISAVAAIGKNIASHAERMRFRKREVDRIMDMPMAKLPEITTSGKLEIIKTPTAV